MLPSSRTWSLLAAALSLAAAPVHAQGPSERLYGEVRTAAGQRYQGYLRWDRNEAGWWDLLHGRREVDPDLVAAALGEDVSASRARSVEFLGVRISWNEDPELGWAESAIRFGQVASLTVTGDDRARLLLRSGEEAEFYGGSTDLGAGFRGLVVDDPVRGRIELDWQDLDRVDFTVAGTDAPAPADSRLHGTVEDRWGQRWQGYVSWDLDEVLTTDVLDGEDRGRERAIHFADIQGIERASATSARVLLAGGEEVELSGSNDVGAGHRGVQVSDPRLGQVDVPWSEFRSVRFHPAAVGEPVRAAFDGGVRLQGTVTTEDGERLQGLITWDADEAWSWEMLDGRWRGLDFDVEFGQVAAIRKAGGRSAVVTLRDGRSLELEGSNDVSRANKGILVETEGGETVAVSWERFRDVTFRTP